MLVDTDAGRVDHHDLAFECGRNRRKQPVPHSGFGPADEPVVASCRGAVALWYLSPRRPSAEPPENAVQHPPVINARHSARLVRQQRLDNRPFPIHMFVSPPRHPASISMESLSHASRQTSSQFRSLRSSPLESFRGTFGYDQACADFSCAISFSRMRLARVPPWSMPRDTGFSFQKSLPLTLS